MGSYFSQLKDRAVTRYQFFLWKAFEFILPYRYGLLLDALWLIGARTLPVDPIDGTTPLMHYALNGDEDNVQLLAIRYRDQIASSAMNGQSVLQAAATSGSIQVCRILCDNGADINKQSDRGHSALMIACSMGHVEVAAELLKRGAQANLCDVDLKTAQHFSVKSLGCLNLILKATKGKLLSARDTNGKTPIMVALMLGGEDEIFEALMIGLNEYQKETSKSVMNIQSNDGMTALMHASHKGLIKALNQLIKAGSDMSLRDAYGQTALHLAAKARQANIMSTLLRSTKGCNYGENDELLWEMQDDDGLLAIHAVISGLTSCRNEQESRKACECMDVLLKAGTLVTGKDFSDITALHLLIQSFFNHTNEEVSLSSYYIEAVSTMINMMTENGKKWENVLLVKDESDWTCLHYMYEFITKHEDKVEARKCVIDLIESFINQEVSNKIKLDLNKERKPKLKYLELRGAYHRIPIEDREDVLQGDRTLQGIANRLLRKDLSTKKHKVVVLCGAGISTSAGIPDYRSNTGIYQTKAGRDAFSSFHEDPSLFWEFARKTFGPIIQGEIKPTLCHLFLKQLDEKDMLQRVYTQNVDGLEVRAGVPEDKVIQCHGTISTVRCSVCSAPPMNSTPIFFPPNSTSSRDIPLCETCSSPLRPDVTFFGEPLSPKFFTHQNEDFSECTMLIVMGTTLQVFPFASLVGKPSILTPRLLINKELTGPFRQLDDGNHKFRDVAYVGGCDEGVAELATLLGW